MSASLDKLNAFVTSIPLQIAVVKIYPTSASISRLLKGRVPPNEKNRPLIRYFIDNSDSLSPSDGFFFAKYRLGAVPVSVYEWNAYLKDSVKKFDTHIRKPRDKIVPFM